jgi:hypothetical protein
MTGLLTTQLVAVRGLLVAKGLVTAEEADAAAQVADLEDMLDRPSEKDKPCSGETTNREDPRRHDARARLLRPVPPPAPPPGAGAESRGGLRGGGYGSAPGAGGAGPGGASEVGEDGLHGEGSPHGGDDPQPASRSPAPRGEL